VNLVRTAACIALFLAGWMPAGDGRAAAARPVERAMLEKVNSVRADHDLEPLRAAPRLHRSARRYARWMLRHDYFGHQERIRAPRFRLLGENLAWHTGRRPRVRGTFRAWLRSPGHRALILDARFRWIGAGMARGRMGEQPATTWVLHLGG
jgi:uncharacterized protein YkwD